MPPPPSPIAVISSSSQSNSSEEAVCAGACLLSKRASAHEKLRQLAGAYVLIARALRSNTRPLGWSSPKSSPARQLLVLSTARQISRNDHSVEPHIEVNHQMSRRGSDGVPFITGNLNLASRPLIRRLRLEDRAWALERIGVARGCRLPNRSVRACCEESRDDWGRCDCG
jgi:hypothetical protein